jgi:hypothetical protein
MTVSSDTRMEIEAFLIGKSFNYPKGLSPRESHVAFKIPHVYDFTIKLYRQQLYSHMKHEKNARNGGQS